MPGGSRIGGVGLFSVQLYFGLGYSLLTINGQTIKRYRKDWCRCIQPQDIRRILPDFSGTVQRAVEDFT